jgi:hypothetical protein
VERAATAVIDVGVVGNTGGRRFAAAVPAAQRMRTAVCAVAATMRRKGEDLFDCRTCFEVFVDIGGCRWFAKAPLARESLGTPGH